jgi:hypothetical protein
MFFFAIFLFLIQGDRDSDVSAFAAFRVPQSPRQTTRLRGGRQVEKYH